MPQERMRVERNGSPMHVVAEHHCLGSTEPCPTKRSHAAPSDRAHLVGPEGLDVERVVREDDRTLSVTALNEGTDHACGGVAVHILHACLCVVGRCDCASCWGHSMQYAPGDGFPTECREEMTELIIFMPICLQTFRSCFAVSKQEAHQNVGSPWNAW